MAEEPKLRRAARNAHPPGDGGRVVAGEPPARRRDPITAERITTIALDIVAERGYEALTMRSVAAALDTGPASLYAHVVNKADLDELIIGRICAEIRLPTPDASQWRAQILDVCAQLRDQYLRYPGVSRAALAMLVTNLDAARLSEGMLAILLAGGIAPQVAAWTIDALFLYVNAYTLELSLASHREAAGDDLYIGPDERDELVARFEALPADEFPLTRRYAAELTSGSGHDRYDFALALIVDALPAG